MQILVVLSVTAFMCLLWSAGSMGDDPQRPGTVFRDCADCPEMVVVPPGNFVMGSPRDEPGGYEDERPQHQVEIEKAFAVARFEITVAQYRQFFEETGGAVGRSCLADDLNGDGEPDVSLVLGWDNPGLTWITGYKSRNQGKDSRGLQPQVAEFRQSERDPVVCVSWADAQAYVGWLSQRTQMRYRLLTEAEWEYAARAGTVGPFPWESGFSGLCAQANGLDNSAHLPSMWDSRIVVMRPDCDDGYPFTSPVGSFPPNAFGLYDMIGNAKEWVEDCYREVQFRGPTYEGAPADGSANQQSCLGDFRVVRGGDWEDDASGLRPASRGAASEGDRYHYGIRIARDL